MWLQTEKQLEIERLLWELGKDKEIMGKIRPRKGLQKVRRDGEEVLSGQEFSRSSLALFKGAIFILKRFLGWGALLNEGSGENGEAGCQSRISLPRSRGEGPHAKKKWRMGRGAPACVGLEENGGGDARGCAVTVNMQLPRGVAGLTITTSKHNSVSRGKDVVRNLNQIKIKIVKARRE